MKTHSPQNERIKRAYFTYLAEAKGFSEATLDGVAKALNRFETYTILGEPGSGDMCLNGAAARLVHPGDKIIVITYAEYEDAELEDYQPTVVHVDTENRAVDPSLVPLTRRYVEFEA